MRISWKSATGLIRQVGKREKTKTQTEARCGGQEEARVTQAGGRN